MTLCHPAEKLRVDELVGSMEKIYVAVGNDVQEGFKTLEWALRKWQPVDSLTIGGIVLVHVSHNISKDFVYGPFGKLPASSVSEGVLDVLKKQQQDDIDGLLNKYVNFCGKVKVEIVKVEKYEEPIYKLLVGMISGLHMTKLVVDLTFMKVTSSSSSWKSRTVIRGLYYAYQQKPDFCEMYIVRGGKPVQIREEDDAEGTANDNQVITITARMREKRSIKGWLGKMMFPENDQPPPTNQSDDPTNRWEDNVQEIDKYFQLLLSEKADEGSNHEDHTSSSRAHHAKTDSALRATDNSNSNMSATDKVETLKSRIQEAHQTVERHTTEAKAHAEGRLKVEKFIQLCKQRIEDLETCLEEERSTQASFQRDLEVEQQRIQEVAMDTEESKRRLHSLAQVRVELSNKLRMSLLSKSQAEAPMEKAVIMRSEMVREIEELRRQRDILRRRIEFCRERDVIGAIAELNENKFGYREYTEDDIRLATDNFSERRRLKTSHGRNIYRGRIDRATTVAIEVYNGTEEAFDSKVRLLSQIKHPHVITMIGFCRKLNCIIYEYMHIGSLKDILNSSSMKSRDFTWHDRLRVAHEISLGLGFLHSAKPKPFVHGHLTASNILLDRNLVAKLGSPELTECTCENDERSDIRAFGCLMLHLLIVNVSAGLFDEEGNLDQEVLAGAIDERAEEWPRHMAKRYGEVARRCISIARNEPVDAVFAIVIEKLGEMRGEAEAHLTSKRTAEVASNIHRSDDLKDIPSCFLCPIFRDIMKNPHVAADGFSYELEAIQEWLWTGHDTSPMTNLRLEHKFLTPNHILRSLIGDWQNRRLDPLPHED